MLVNFFANMLDSSILQFASFVFIAKSVIWSRISTSIRNADLGDMERALERFVSMNDLMHVMLDLMTRLF
jgi:hypothetical protein